VLAGLFCCLPLLCLQSVVACLFMCFQCYRVTCLFFAHECHRSEASGGQLCRVRPDELLAYRIREHPYPDSSYVQVQGAVARSMFLLACCCIRLLYYSLHVAAISEISASK
jgi:hypothetical protein